MKNLLNQYLAVAVAVLSFVFPLRGDIVDLSKGTGWNITGLHDTKPEDAAWSLKIYKNGVLNEEASRDPLEFDAPYVVSPDYTTEGLVDGVYRRGGTGGEMLSIYGDEWRFGTAFSIEKTISNPQTAVAHLAFAFVSSYEISSIFVNGKAVEFLADRTNPKNGWFEILLTADPNENWGEDISLEFVYDFTDTSTTNLFLFGVKFDGENSSITSLNPSAPEPATLALCGLGLAGLALRRSFRRRPRS